MIMPFKNSNSVKLTSPYGYRDLNGKQNWHSGYDLVGIESKEVIAVAGGTVIRSRIITNKNNLTWEWGNYVCVKTNDNHYHYYCHLDSRAVIEGQVIQAGDTIGIMGNTGYSFGAHLHFEVRTSDGKTTICPETVLNIPNVVGTYTADVLDLDIQKLQEKGIINSPTYWINTAPTVNYLSDLIHNMAEYLRKEK